MLEADEESAGGEGEAEMESRDLEAEVVRLTLELHEATEEKLQAARYGLVVLEESSALKMKHRQLEEEHETLKVELQQLREVGTSKAINNLSTCTTSTALLYLLYLFLLHIDCVMIQRRTFSFYMA